MSALTIVSEWPPRNKDAYVCSNTVPVLQWREYESIDWDIASKHPERSLINSYCIRKALIRKIQMANAFQHYCAKRPQSLLKQHVPETWIFRLDHPDYLDEALNECWEVERGFRNNLSCNDPKQLERFIMKPSMTGRGVGIYLLDSLSGMETMIEELFGESDSEAEDANEDADSEQGSAWLLREWVIQRYIAQPTNASLFISRNAGTFAGTDYDITSIESLQGHLTNTCLQQHNEAFDEAQAVRAFWDLTNHGLEATTLEQIFNQCASVLGECFAAVSSDAIGFQPMPNAFELYGFDFLIDESHNVWLLEANAFPDFAQTGHRLRDLVRGLFEATVKVAVCPFVDAINQSTSFDDTLPKDDRLRLVYDRNKSM
ncbi:tubulin-tyrosine ligase family-domain-containing protein [Syncephalis fuscata]|nr:tubulin-tyrosine ligase family-domain-containing protein [Syncephalis fuscata]